ncbi:hypothetical protein IMSAG025_00725 [Muribaculaceae bacterium]|nr:hypothetical protein IMSAGC016_00164 [Muribaculaceae bacterium]GFI57286.1 hypothetical protein IMSAG025_00725 [Muribaculaceae bacterium]
MNISGSLGEVDKVGFAQPRQASIDSVEQIVSRDIIRRLYPLYIAAQIQGHMIYPLLR